MQSVNHTATGDDPHDLRHGVAMEMYGDHGDLEKVRALLGHQRIDTTQVNASFRPTQLERSVEFLEAKASRMLNVETESRASCSINKIEMVAPTGFGIRV